jgi:hypothetical protein
MVFEDERTYTDMEEFPEWAKVPDDLKKFFKCIWLKVARVDEKIVIDLAFLKLLFVEEFRIHDVSLPDVQSVVDKLAEKGCNVIYNKIRIAIAVLNKHLDACRKEMALLNASSKVTKQTQQLPSS